MLPDRVVITPPALKVTDPEIVAVHLGREGELACGKGLPARELESVDNRRAGRVAREDLRSDGVAEAAVAHIARRRGDR